MKTLKQYNNQIDELIELDEDTRNMLVEISVGKLTTTALIGRLKLISRKIKDPTLRKAIMTLGHLTYTVSLQSLPPLTEINDKLDKIKANVRLLEVELNKVRSDLNRT
jgi:hypothetical protein